MTENDVYDAAPIWSPDGSQIAFISKRGQHFQLFILNLANGEENQVTDTGTTIYSPTWSPDGRYIAYVSVAGSNCQINAYELASGKSYLVANDYSKYSGLSWKE